MAGKRRLSRHLLLVGLPAAGKSTVGQLVAAALGVQLRDIDALIESRSGMGIPQIFTTQGEAVFRSLECAETMRALTGDPMVVVPGGGWAAQPGNLDQAKRRALTVYLHTSPEQAATRTLPQSERPLLSGADVVAKIREFLAERAAFYEQCDTRVDTDGKTAEEVASEVVEVALGGGGG
jgi:shikimate kinase